MDGILIHPIARIKSAFPTKFGIPRQSGLVEELRATVIFEPDYRIAEAIRGIGDFSHIWLIWQFSETAGKAWTPTVRPPRLGGNTRLGVFATRSPFRPNNLGLSCVRLLGTEITEEYGPILHIAGADLMDGTPIVDIKPYIPYADCHTDASGGFASAGADYLLQVDFPQTLLQKLPEELRQAAIGVLEQDPRPSYHKDPHRNYGLPFGDFDIRFRVSGQRLTVLEVAEQETAENAKISKNNV